MKIANSLTALALVAMFAILPGCDNKPGDDIPRAVTNNETTEPVESPAEPVAVPEPVETPMEEPAESPAQVEAPEPVAAGEAATYTIAPNDESIFGFTGYKVTGSQQGGWSEYEGTVELPDGSIESAKINITIKMDSLFSGSTMLTETLREESWFHVEEYPEAKFTSTKVEKTDDGYMVSGDLTLRGVTKGTSFPAQINVDGDQLTTQAEFALDRNDWGISDEGFAGDLVKDEVVIQFEIVANKS